jgi:hypothetical protein
MNQNARIPIEVNPSDDPVRVYKDVMELAKAIGGRVLAGVSNVEGEEFSPERVLAYQINVANFPQSALLDVWKLLIKAAPADRQRILRIATNAKISPEEQLTEKEKKVLEPFLETMNKRGLGAAPLATLLFNIIIALVNLMNGSKSVTINNTIYNIQSPPSISASSQSKNQESKKTKSKKKRTKKPSHKPKRTTAKQSQARKTRT